LFPRHHGGHALHWTSRASSVTWREVYLSRFAAAGKVCFGRVTLCQQASKLELEPWAALPVECPFDPPFSSTAIIPGKAPDL